MILNKPKNNLIALATAFILLFVIAAPIFLTPAEAVSQTEINALKKQQEQLAAQKAEIQAQADALNSELASQEEKLEILSEQIKVTNAEIENLTEQIAIYTNTIAAMENELTLDKQKEEELLEHFKVRLRAMEESGSFSYISILFGASDFQDLLTRIDCIRSIIKYDDNLYGALQEAQEETRIAKENMEDQMAAQELVFDEYKEKQADLLVQQEEAQAVLESLSADSADYDKQLESVKALQSSLGTQISDMETRLAEQQRLIAEQNAAKQISSGNNGSWYSDSGASGTGQDIVTYAETFLGVNYVYGGTSPSGFDCSGLVYYCYRHFGYTVNRTAAGLAYNGVAVSSTALQPGDVLLFTSTDGSYIGHTGIYIGGGQFIHAPHTGDVVKISNLSDSYYTSHYWGARRIIS